MWHKKAHKYGAKKTEIDGIKFDSKAEGDYYVLLKTLELAKQLKILDLQPKVYLTKARILYKPDFLIEENGKRYYVDVKGMTTPIFQIKKRLWRAYCKDVLRIVKKKGKNFVVAEEVVPQ